MKRIILALLLLSPLTCRFSFLLADDETENTGAIWTEVNVTKALPYNLSIEGSLEHRTIDWFDWSSRVSAGLGLNYKVNKYMKIGLGYTFIEKHNQEEWKDHYSDKTGKWNGYNVDSPNWANRHRLSLDLTGTVKLHKVLRITLRERYQFTHQASRDVDRMKLRDPSYDGDLKLIELEDTTYTIDHKSHKNRHLLRSRQLVVFTLECLLHGI